VRVVPSGPAPAPGWLLYRPLMTGPLPACALLVFFISWVPDVAKVKAKSAFMSRPPRYFTFTTATTDRTAMRMLSQVLYASSKERFRRELDGIQLEIQATDPSEIEETVLREKCAGVGQ
jgi:hypothetical protein